MARSHQKAIDAKTWKMHNGTLVELEKMSDGHLSNAIKMAARNCNRPNYSGEMKDDKAFIKLVNEGKRRKFQISILNTPIVVDGRREYVDVFIPKSFPQMKISATILPTDWDSRPQE